MNSSGKIFEEKVCDYLLSEGYKILDRNFTSKFGEIDIICLKDNILHYVEVKARRSDAAYYPSESVTPSKISKIRSTAKFFLLKNTNLNNFIMQFDVVEYIIDKKTINHIKNCFY